MHSINFTKISSKIKNKVQSTNIQDSYHIFKAINATLMQKKIIVEIY